MVRADRLLQFITQLQGEGNVAQRRKSLLRYICESSGAHYAALFVLEEQVLVLLDQNGSRLAAQGQEATEQYDLSSARNTIRVPLHGLLGATLHTQGLISVPDLATDARASLEERALAWPGASGLVSSVKESDTVGSKQGVLLLLFGNDQLDGSKKRIGQVKTRVENEGDVLICIALLSTYLSEPAEEPVPASLRREQPSEYDELDRALAQLLRNRRIEQQGTLPELLYSLSSITDLYELGLVIGTDVAPYEFYQHILGALGRVVLAQGACLLLYEPTGQRFIQVASQGSEPPCSVLAHSLNSHEMERLALRGPGETITTMMAGEQKVLLVTLSCNCLLLGVAALAILEEDQLLEERMLLLSYMSNVGALILKNHELRTLEVQEAIEQERSRIAHDIHDGPIQSFAHVLHRLEILRHLLERQPKNRQDMLREVKRAYQIQEASLHELRHDIASLLPAELEEQDFLPALEELINDYRQSELGLYISSTFGELPAIAPGPLQAAIFRCIQEALNNVRKHAHARKVTIRLQMVEEQLQVEVSDDGVGMQGEPLGAQVRGKARALPTDGQGRPHVQLGLRSMEERIKSVGGMLEVESKQGAGTTVRARFPLAQYAAILTLREREVLRLIAQGFTNSGIAHTLAISPETVKSHVHHIMQKLQVTDRTRAAVIATQRGWL